uniref:Uncharacterized protein n=1 Tax=Micrurus lemniscatus lemniscatus TaxID=129467 RepID=A0A2D4J4Q6_MICLE
MQVSISKLHTSEKRRQLLFMLLLCPLPSILRKDLDKIAEIKSLLEERRIAAKIAGLYNDSEPPRKTMRRGVLMTLLQQSAMTLPLWIGKPGEKPFCLVSCAGPLPFAVPSLPLVIMWPNQEIKWQLVSRLLMGMSSGSWLKL